MAISFQSSNQQANPQDIQAVLNLLNSRQMQSAANAAKNLIEKFPNTFILHNVLGIALDSLGDFEGAINSYRHALKLQPGDASFLPTSSLVQRALV